MSEALCLGRCGKILVDHQPDKSGTYRRLWADGRCFTCAKAAVKKQQVARPARKVEMPARVQTVAAKPSADLTAEQEAVLRLVEKRTRKRERPDIIAMLGLDQRAPNLGSDYDLREWHTAIANRKRAA